MEKDFHNGLEFTKCGQQLPGFTNSENPGQNTDKLIVTKKNSISSDNTKFYVVVYRLQKL